MQVVCLNVGERYPDVYVERLYRMCLRHLPLPFEFHCFTDRPRELSPEIIQRDASEWGLEGWWAKLRLFDRSVIHQEFFFLDLDTVIIRNLSPLLSFVEEHPKTPIIAMRDFTFGTLSSAIMWVRPSEVTEGIWNAYARGEWFPELDQLPRSIGDQDFIWHYLKSRGLESTVIFFPPEWFASYKHLRRLHASQPQASREKLNQALILCFHGEPRPHQALDPWKSLWLLLRHKPLRVFSYWRFLEKELREWWK